MSFLKPSLLNQDIQTQNNELCWEKTEVENQTNETVSGNKTENTNCVTNIHNYGGNIPPEIKEYIDKRIDEKFEEIKANFIPKTAKPKLSIIQYATALDMHLWIRNLGDISAENISIRVPEDEKQKLCSKGWIYYTIKECFEKSSFTLHSNEKCEFAVYHGHAFEPLKPRPFKFLLTYNYQDDNGTEHPVTELLPVNIGTFTFG